MRQLVHELRTPTTAIAGFAEMIEGELLGPVPAPYRDYAGNIRHQARGLLGAIDDLDTAARLDSNALDLRPESVDL
ncbi:histidine kinase dimerization/phospho-acceptor domain-containing protein, partial [Acinetobacter baumannii]